MHFEDTTVIPSARDLVEYYRIKSSTELRLGIEWERSGVFRDTFKPVQYKGDQGYLAVLKKLAGELGWEIIDGYRNNIYELQRGNARVTIEADGRLELAGSARDNLHDLSREFRIHANEVKEVSDFLNIGWLPLGWQPFHSDKQIKLISKKRYHIFMDMMPSHWTEATLKRNNGLTSNYSYLDEDNAIKKVQIAFRVLPVVGAMFASGPFDSGTVSGLLDMRRHCIFQYDARNNMPEHILDPDFSFESWIKHYLKLPVYLIVREGKPDLKPNKKLTFAQWIKKGYEGIFPTFEDFDQHVKTVWSDIRLRRGYLEYRVADSVPFKMAMAVPALIKGLVFDSQSWRAVEKLTKGWTYQDIITADREAWKTGLQTELKGKTLLFYAKQIIEIANDALHRLQNTKAIDDGEDESIYLAPLKEQIFIKEKSVAEELVDLWEGDWDRDQRRLLEWCEEEM